MSQVDCSVQNMRLKLSVNFLCPVLFIHFDLFIVSYPGRPESRFRDAGQYLTVTASPFNVLLETLGGAVVKLAVLLSLSAAVAQYSNIALELECNLGTATLKTFCIYQKVDKFLT